MLSNRILNSSQNYIFQTVCVVNKNSEESIISGWFEPILFPFSALTQSQKKKKIPTPEKTYIHSCNKVHGALTVFMWVEKGDMQRALRASFHLFTSSGTIILPWGSRLNWKRRKRRDLQEIGLIQKNSSKELLLDFISRGWLSNLLGWHNHPSAGESGPHQPPCSQAWNVWAAPNERLGYSPYTFRRTLKAKALKAKKTKRSHLIEFSQQWRTAWQWFWISGVFCKRDREFIYLFILVSLSKRNLVTKHSLPTRVCKHFQAWENVLIKDDKHVAVQLCHHLSHKKSSDVCNTERSQALPGEEIHSITLQMVSLGVSNLISHYYWVSNY